MKTGLLIFSLAAITAVTITILPAQQTPPAPTVMELKLSSAQGILSGLATEDYERISTHANSLLALAKQQWIDQESPEYRAQLKDFWLVLEGLQANARERNLDGVTLSYVQMTLSCVKCHKYLREARAAD